MTEYARPSVYRIGYTIEVFNGNGGIESITSDFSRYGYHGFISNDHPVEYFRAVEDGIFQLQYELNRFHEHILERIREVEKKTIGGAA